VFGALFLSLAVSLLMHLGLGQSCVPRHDTAQQQLSHLRDALELFRIKVGRLPSTEEGLAVLGRPRGRSGSALIERVPLDPWGRPLVYRRSAAREPFLASTGPDGVLFTCDDIRPGVPPIDGVTVEAAPQPGRGMPWAGAGAVLGLLFVFVHRRLTGRGT